LSRLSRADVYFVLGRVTPKRNRYSPRIISESFISIRDDVSIFNRAQLQNHKYRIFPFFLRLSREDQLQKCRKEL